MSKASVSKPDGRNERVNKGKEAVIQAILEMVVEGKINLTVAEISARAGISQRTFARYFSTIGELMTVFYEYFWPVFQDLVVMDAPDEPLKERVIKILNVRIQLVQTFGELNKSVEEHLNDWDITKKSLKVVTRY